MKPGNVVLISLPQRRGGVPKIRPALLLAALPGAYQNLLICGISTKIKNLEPAWDELLDPAQPDFGTSGLHHPSCIRLSYLYAADTTEISGTIGRISRDRLRRLRGRLADHLSS